jgi:glycosyltransferase involved in cell wall biosynthesis
LLEHADIFSDLDVIYLSSLNEGLPVCLVETPTLDSMREIVEPATNRELVKSGEVEAFAEALGKATRDHIRLVSARGAAVRAKYSTARMVASIEAIYEELLQ